MLRPDALCRVTLLEKIGNGKISLPYGQESRLPLDGTPPSDEDFTDPSRCAALGTDPGGLVIDSRRRMANFAVPVHFDLDFSDPNLRSVDVPVGCAKLHFGDWEVRAGFERSVYQLTINQEKGRVASHWGDYRYPRPQQGSKGDVDKRIIGPPPMPKVKIQVLDSRLHTPLEPAIFPHEIWNFEADIDHEAVAEVKRRGLAAGAPIATDAATPLDLSKLSLQDLAMLRKLLLEAPVDGAVATPPAKTPRGAAAKT